MARIRSIHPGLFTDEAFAPLSSDAQMLLIGIWTEADDQGVFEWKPLTLRMRLRPAKDGDICALLDEIVASNSVKRFEFDGKSYGAIRNFRKWQRPEKPKHRFPLPDDMRQYVHLSPIDQQPITDNSPKVHSEEGGRREEEEEGDKKENSASAFDSKFEEFWRACPKKVGKGSAEAAYRSAFANPDPPTHEQLVAAMKAYAVKVSTEKTEARFTKQPSHWLTEKRWLDEDLKLLTAAAACAVSQVFVPEGTAAFIAWERHLGRKQPAVESRSQGNRRGWYFASEHPPDMVPRETSPSLPVNPPMEQGA